MFYFKDYPIMQKKFDFFYLLLIMAKCQAFVVHFNCYPELRSFIRIISEKEKACRKN